MKNLKSRINFFLSALILSTFVFISGCKTKEETSAYLFVYFTGNAPGEEAIRYAVSEDGFHFRALNNNEPVINSKKISTSGGVRDPHILRGNDGKTFYMVATDLYVQIGRASCWERV